ncbi:ABC-2 transporter permease [Mariprofundus ferrooxydans]|nr:ABC-2 transporter permease [Mariprofundus ferrooxydans]
MSAMFALCQKEWRISLDTPQGYVVSIAFLLASGFFFGSSLFLNGQADMRHWFAVLPLLYIFFIPAMSMRLLADELHDGTYELLSTMPTRTLDIVLGKYLSLIGHITFLLALTWLYPLTLSLLGNLDMGIVLSSYLAAWLLAALFSAMCLYASSLTQHAMIAYIVGLILLLVVFLLTQASPTLPIVLQDWIALLGPINHYQHMLRGVVSLADVMLFISLTVIFLSLTWFAFERRRWR